MALRWSSAQAIGEAFDQWSLGTDDDTADSFLDNAPSETDRVLAGVDVVPARADARGAAVTGAADHFLDALGGGEMPCECVLPAPRSDHQYLHESAFSRRGFGDSGSDGPVSEGPEPAEHSFPEPTAPGGRAQGRRVSHSPRDTHRRGPGS